jgi:AcrR family transcriptional regulator
MKAKGERTRARLLELAVDRFATAGYQRTSVSEIARQAGLTPAAAYAYFPNKTALFEAAVDADADALIDEATGGLGLGSARDRLLALVASLVTGVERHPLARRVLAGLEPNVMPRLLELPALVRLRALAVEELRAGQRSGAVRADVDPEALALGLETIVLAVVMIRLQVGSPDEARFDARRRSVVAVLDAALRPAAPMQPT